ncbi:MAG: glycoside hydrolase family 95 protein [Prevotellaceae bacterium]|jgi:alpha-L-fucosidase 2|nr:glycoside hydrolase family 95 protein [Prevotellaceae bacterium]
MTNKIKCTLLSLPAACLLLGCDYLLGAGGGVPHRVAYHFDEPAKIWEETFPLGNGRIGLMPDGGINEERYVLNEISMWSGSKQNTDNPNALKSLPKIRELLFGGRNDEAQQLMYETFVCGGEGSREGYRRPYGSYQLLGNLTLSYLYENGQDAAATGYRRELSLENAIATVSFKKGGHVYTREAFTSFSSDVALIRLTASGNKALSFRVGLSRPERYAVAHDRGDLRLYGRLYEGDAYSPAARSGKDKPSAAEKEGKGVRYGARLRVLLPDGGLLSVVGDTALAVEKASEAIIVVGMATDYFGKDLDRHVDSLVAAAAAKDYDALKEEHVEAYRRLYDRVHVDFGHVPEKERLPINKRLHLFHSDKNDPSLQALYFQLGRYLLISSTRPGLLPPNLQGLWCNTINTPWNGDYHLNINAQMNLWPAEPCNLSELHLPLIEWTKQQVPSGQRTAKVFYNARGWVTHILGNVWEFTAPGEHPSWGSTNTSAAWMCAHLYQHYLYTKDTAYLASVYPVMKEAALFFVDMLVEDPRTRYLVTAPTTSPENVYVLPNGRKASVCAGSTMDNQILRELFGNIIEAAAILGVDEDFAAIVAEKRARLTPTTIGKDGRIMEWLEPFGEADLHHRHVSHLYGLHPAGEISVEKTPALAQAARKTLEARGDESTGWSMAWKINFWARLHDGEHAWKLLTDLLKPSIQEDVSYAHGGGTYPNLFCAHPPFQIDGNFGGCAGIAEMLIQSHSGCVEFLPALPAAWKTGSFDGMRVQGGAEVAAAWTDGKLKRMTLKAVKGGAFRIKMPAHEAMPKVKINGKPASCPVEAGILEASLNAGDEMVLAI